MPETELKTKRRLEEGQGVSLSLIFLLFQFMLSPHPHPVFAARHCGASLLLVCVGCAVHLLDVSSATTHVFSRRPGLSARLDQRHRRLVGGWMDGG